MVPRIYFFDEGDSSNKKLLGGKGVGLCKMAQLGLVVPPGFIITTEVCSEFYGKGRRLPSGLMDEVRGAMSRLEDLAGKKFGDPAKPLFVSVRSGAAVSMPGMMDTVLNLGMNDSTVKGLAELTGDERFAYDPYRRFVQLFGKIVLGVDDEHFSQVFDEAKMRSGVKYDFELQPSILKELVVKFKEICYKESREPFPDDPYVQLEKAIAAVFRSWMGKRCVDYRREFRITPDLANGTAVTVQTMVFGNIGDDSATGVVFTRDPATGQNGLYGDYLLNAQGEDVVAGIRTPKPIQELKMEMPDIYEGLVEIGRRLEKQYRESQDMEFTVESGKLYMLQTRNAKMNALALVKTSVDMVKEGILSKGEALMRIDPEQLEQLLHRRVDPASSVKPIAVGIAASPGAVSGKVVFSADEAEVQERRGERVILVREETKPEDIHGFFASQGILTSRGGKTSHAAVVARGMGKPCVCGCSEVLIDLEKRVFTVEDLVVKEGDIIMIDGGSGSVYLGEVPTLEPGLGEEFNELLVWADEIRRLGVRANADTPETAALARRFGGTGIGLCRTERMFNAVDRLPVVVDMILAERIDERRRALQKLMPLQKEDFKRILRAMEGFPVTIRLLDPPLHEFLPRIEELVEEIRRLKQEGVNQAVVDAKTKMLMRVRALTEVNPMLGHRGVRVGLTFPEIYEMQVEAIYEAVAELIKEDVDARAQIMVPQVALAEELVHVKKIVEDVRKRVEEKYGLEIRINFGTMIEVVRACMTAGEIAEVVDFFSFGTNDLTQATFSFSREDAENKFLPQYIGIGVLKNNPFQTIDLKGVGRLMKIAVEEGRTSNPELEVGICGEHGGEPASIELCHELGLTYVSCSPYRIPIARLAAAQAAIKRG